MQGLGIDFVHKSLVFSLGMAIINCMDKFKGQPIIARAHGDRLIVRRIWRVFPWAIEIVSDAQFAMLERGAKTVVPIPFPPEDIYCQDPRARVAIEMGQSVDQAWLRKWHDAGRAG
jgi:hypothetical protein